MRFCALLLFLMPLFAQEPAPPPAGGPPPGGHPPPKNLKLLKPEEVMSSMHAFRVGLNVKCDFCHVQGDFAADSNPHNEIARKMIVMTREINAKFPDGEMHVTCYTCHRGSTEPATVAPEAPKAEGSK